MDARRRSEIQLFIAALLFSTGGAAVKACRDISPWQIASFRCAMALLLILLVLPESRRGWNGRTFIVALAYAATEILFVVGNKLTTAANAIFLQSIAPLHIVLLGPWLLGERLHKRDLPPLLLAGIGLIMFFVGIQQPQDTAPDPPSGNLVALTASVTWALTIMGLRWLGTSQDPNARTIRMDPGAPGSAVPPANPTEFDARATAVSAVKPHSPAESSASPTCRRTDPTISAVAIGNLLAFVVLLPWALPIGNVPASQWLVLAFTGVFQTGLTFILLSRAVPHVSALEVSLLLLIEPVANPIWAWLVHGETPGGWAMLGGVLILAASLLKTRKSG